MQFGTMRQTMRMTIDSAESTRRPEPAMRMARVYDPTLRDEAARGWGTR